MTETGQIGALHLHSDYSHDGRDSLERLREFALERNLSFLALSDHAEDLDREVFAEYVLRCRELSDDRTTLIPGLEYRFAGLRGLHLLALGLSEWIEPHTPEEFVTRVGPAAELTVLAHPLLTHYQVPWVVLDGVDAVEVWNAAYNTRYLPDPRAIQLLRAARARRPEVVATVGLDQHDSRNDRETRVLVPDRDAPPLQELKAGRFINIGKTLRFAPDVEWSPLALTTLTGARWALDGVNRTHDRLQLYLRKRRGAA